MLEMSMHDCVIIGAGISGLGVAAWLAMQGKDVLVLEKAERVGGTMTSVSERGYLIDFGPMMVLNTTSLLDDLIRYAGLTQEVCFAAPQSQHRFILRAGVMQALPTGPGSFLISRLFSARAKLRLLQEPFIAAARHEESIAAFSRRRLGQEFLDYAINPFVSGIYAGDPDRLSVPWAFPKLYALERDYGSLIKGAIKGRKTRQQRQQSTGDRRRDTAKIFSFERGMGTFPEAIAARLGTRLKVGCEVEMLTGAEPGFEVTYRQAGTPAQARARCVVLAIPAYALDRYLRMCDPELLDINCATESSRGIGRKSSVPLLNMTGELADLEYAPVAQVFLGFRREQVGHPLNGFGVLIPHRENRRILGSLWNSSLFPSRAPAGHVAITCFLGGMRHPELVCLDDDRLLALSLEELMPLLSIRGEPDFARIKVWSRAIPQYNLGYGRYAGLMDTFEANSPGVFLCGNFRGGIAVGDCVRQSARTAEKVTAFLGAAVAS